MPRKIVKLLTENTSSSRAQINNLLLKRGKPKNYSHIHGMVLCRLTILKTKREDIIFTTVNAFLQNKIDAPKEAYLTDFQ
jgi:hypothetical protein